MEHLYLAHLLLVLVVVFFPKQPRTTLLAWQHVVLLALLWWDLLSRLYGLLSNRVYFWELCAFYERIYAVEGMFWLLFLYHHIAAFVGLLLMITYLRTSRLFAVFWAFLAAYPLLLDWAKSTVQTDLNGERFYELPVLSTTRRDVTSLIVEFNGVLTGSYLLGLGLVLGWGYYFVTRKQQEKLNS